MFGNLWGSGLIGSLFDKGMNDMSQNEDNAKAADKPGSGHIGAFVKDVTMASLKEHDASKEPTKKSRKKKTTV